MQSQTSARDSVDYETRRRELPYGMANRDEIQNYFSWIVSLFRTHARGSVIDHGAGTGGLSAGLLAAGLGERVIAVEPDPQLVDFLHERFAGQARAEVFPGTLDDYIASHGPACVDTVLSSNVIEHIDNDVACLEAMRDLLKPGGIVGLYVPARPELFGSLDRAVGHFRRYTRPELTRKLEQAGFRTIHVGYRNLVAVLPWVLVGQVLKRERVGTGSLQLFDRVVFPLCRRLEDLWPPAYGLNLVAIAEKPR
jgi:SAM-dependent methyltransferase